MRKIDSMKKLRMFFFFMCCITAILAFHTPCYAMSLNEAITERDCATLKKIILEKFDIDINSQNNETGNTALHRIAYDSDTIDTRVPEIIKILLVSGADQNIKNYAGQTPLFVAISEANSDAVGIFFDPSVKIKPDLTIKCGTNADTSLLRRACETSKNSTKIVELLVKNGADTTEKIPFCNKFYTLAEYAKAWSHDSIAKYLESLPTKADIQNNKNLPSVNATQSTFCTTLAYEIPACYVIYTLDKLLELKQTIESNVLNNPKQAKKKIEALVNNYNNLIPNKLRSKLLTNYKNLIDKSPTKKLSRSEEKTLKNLTVNWEIDVPKNYAELVNERLKKLI